jgi:hypothetical protein
VSDGFELNDSNLPNGAVYAYTPMTMAHAVASGIHLFFMAPAIFSSRSLFPLVNNLYQPVKRQLKNGSGSVTPRFGRFANLPVCSSPDDDAQIPTALVFVLTDEVAHPSIGP